MIELQWLDLYMSIHDFSTYGYDSLITIKRSKWDLNLGGEVTLTPPNYPIYLHFTKVLEKIKVKD